MWLSSEEIQENLINFFKHVPKTYEPPIDKWSSEENLINFFKHVPKTYESPIDKWSSEENLINFFKRAPKTYEPPIDIVYSEIFARILFSRIALKRNICDIKNRDYDMIYLHKSMTE